MNYEQKEQLSFMPRALRIFFLIVICAVSPFTTLAQNKDKIDSLKKVIENADSDTNKVKNYNKIATIYRQTGEYEKAKEAIQKSLELARPIDYTSGVGRALYTKGNILLRRSKYDKAISVYKEGLAVYKNAGNALGEASGYHNIGNIHYSRGNYSKAIDLYKRSLEIKEREGKKKKVASTARNIGVIHFRLGEYDKAMKYSLKVRDIQEEFGDQRGLASTYQLLGLIHDQQEQFDKALEYFKKASAIHKEVENKSGLSSVYSNIGTVHSERENIDSSIHYHRKALEIDMELGSPKKIAATYNNLGGLWMKKFERKSQKESGKGDTSYRVDYFLDSAHNFYKSAYQLLDKIRVPHSKTISLNGLGNVHKKKGEYEKAISFYQKSLNLADSIGARPRVIRSHEKLALCYKEVGDFKKAYEHHREFAKIRDSVFNEKKSEKIAEMEEKYKAEKKKQEIQVLKKEKEKNRAILWSVSAGLGGVFILLIILFTRFRLIRKQRNLIEEKKSEVDKAYTELESIHENLQEKNREITDSIHYASRIQSAILTSDSYLGHTLGEHFVLFKPKEVVSGDFYWAYGDQEHAIWVAADCTGHGVPGAFMSMIGNRLFNEVIVEQGERDPGKILDKVREGIVQALGQSGDEDAKDGMDAAICVLDRSKGVLSFAGANNPLYVIRKGQGNESLSGLEMVKGGQLLPSYDDRIKSMTSDDGSTGLIELKGDKQPIGQPEGEAEHFTTISFQLENGDSLYTFSDGFADQFGGEKGKKYRYKPFKRLLLSLQAQPMKEQKEALEKEFENWKGEKEQIDDVVIIGMQY